MVQKDKALETAQAAGEPSPGPVSGEAFQEAPGLVEESGIGVEPTDHRKFICGVVEGIEYQITTTSNETFHLVLGGIHS